MVNIKNSVTEKARIEWLDLTKAIAIIMVIAGHIIQNYHLLLTNLAIVIYSFHMPLFFILNGYTIKKRDCGLDTFVKTKVKSLIGPYILFCLLELGECMVFDFGSLKSVDIIKVANTLLMRSGGLCGKIWFIPCIFAADILVFLILKYVKKPYFQCMICVGLALVGIVCGFYNVKLPLYMEAAFLAVFFIFAGRCIAEYSHKILGGAMLGGFLPCV